MTVVNFDDATTYKYNDIHYTTTLRMVILEKACSFPLNYHITHTLSTRRPIHECVHFEK